MRREKKPIVGIIGTNGLPGKYGGWDQLVIHLTENLKSQYSFLVYTSYTNSEPGLTEYNGVRLKKVNFKANGIQSVPYDIFSLIHAGFCCDVLYICGTSGCISLPLIRLFNKKIILNPDGQEWKRKKWSKLVKWFLKMSENFGIRFSDIVVADNKKIQEYIYERYNINSILIEYGGDHVLKLPMRMETSKRYMIKSNEYAFKVCRIEPENNIHLILEAFKIVQSMNLIIIGNWDNSEYGKLLRKKYSQFDNLKLLDPIYNQVTLDELRSNCSLYIHGHSVGGTNPSLVEAMNLGLCIVSYNVSYNIETTENKAVYFENENDLINLLLDYKNNLINISAYQASMKEIAERRYKWCMITEKYSKIFN